MKIRIPGWARQEAIPSDLYSFRSNKKEEIVININGAPVAYTMDKGYAVITREWKKGDQVQMNLPMEIQRVYSNENLKDNKGLVSLQRGPLTYCAEWTDNNNRTSNLVLPSTASLVPEFKADLLNGVTVLKGEAIVIETGKDNLSVSSHTQPFVAIPYYAWANRGKGEMNVWLPETIKDLSIIAQ